jgi:hypothetical protein
MVYDPALTQAKAVEPRLSRLVEKLSSGEQGSQLLTEAKRLGIRLAGREGTQPVLLPMRDLGLWEDIEALVWQVERIQQKIRPSTRNYLDTFSQLTTRVSKRAHEITDELAERTD